MTSEQHTEELVAGSNTNTIDEAEVVMETQTAEAQADAQAQEDNGDDQGQILAALEVEKKDLQDKLLRLAAEFENYKKRMQRERETFLKYAEEPLLKELLPAIDNLERALAQEGSANDGEAMRQGVDLTLKGLLSATAKFGLTPIDSAGQPFDPNLHEALVMEASDQVPPQSVLREFEKGYYYKDRLLRAAKVVVAKACE